MTVGSNKLPVPHSAELRVGCFEKRQSDIPKQSRALTSQLTSIAD